MNNLTKNRCSWCLDHPINTDYHDNEWGVPSYDAAHLFEMLVLESFQAGLSWLTVLKKRQGFLDAFADLNPTEIAKFSDDKLEQILMNPAIIRNRHKVFATRINAKAWLKLNDPVSFLWDTINGKPIINHFKEISDVPSQTEQSISLSKKLKQAGFVRFGPTTCYAFMQSTGMVMDHLTSCFRHHDLCKN